MSELERMKKWDGDSMKQYMLKAVASARLPQECIDKAATDQVFSARGEVAGRRLAKWPDGSIAANGSVDWAKLGVYFLDFRPATGARVLRVVHRPTGAEHIMQEHELVLNTFDLTDNWSDDRACVSLRAIRYRLIDFFADGKGPNALPT